MHRLLPKDRLLRLSGRLWWAGLIALHVPALVSVVGDLADTPSWTGAFAGIGIVATVTLFALKLADVRILRLGGYRRSALAFLLVCAIAHHEVVATDAAGDVAATVPAVLVTGATIVAVRGLSSRSLRAWRRLADALAARPANALAFAGLRDQDVLIRPVSALACSRTSRGPPR